MIGAVDTPREASSRTMAESQAEVRRTTDSVSGNPPETEPIDPVTDMVNRREAEEER